MSPFFVRLFSSLRLDSVLEGEGKKEFQVHHFFGLCLVIIPFEADFFGASFHSVLCLHPIDRRPRGL